MTKIKILHAFMILFLMLGVLGIIGNLLAIFMGNFNWTAIYTDGTFGIVKPIISLVLSIIMLFGVFQIQQALYFTLKCNYFNAKSTQYLKRGGLILMLFSVAGIANDFIIVDFDNNQSLLLSSINYSLILIIGIAVLAVSDIISKGKVIEQENLLTI